MNAYLTGQGIVPHEEVTLMPIYEYKCWNCGAFFQKLQSISERNESVLCPKCGSTETTRIPSSFSGMSKGCADRGDYGGFT